MIAHLTAIVAIPVKDEAERIVACLDALAAQRDDRDQPVHPSTYGVVLMLNNCTDGTAGVVRQVQERLPYRLWILERKLPPHMANAGWARKLAMDAAADLLETHEAAPPRMILTTDADSRAGPRWITANLKAAAAGADLVAGFMRADRAEHAQLPVEMIRRGRLEDRYDWLLTELVARLDPEEHDPWPRHRIASGASLGVTLAAYRRIGGLPAIATGEDRALAEQITLIDGRIRHCLKAQVVVSCRLDGRAAGGMAETIRQRALEPELACDPALEPAARLAHRARWRAELRRRHRDGRLLPCEPWAMGLQLDRATAASAAVMQHFGAAWAAIEQASPTLAYHPLTPRQLPSQIAVAESLLAGLRDGHPLSAPLQHVDAIELGPILKHDPRERRGGDEVLRRVVAAERIVSLAGPVHQDDVALRRHRPLDEGGYEPEVARAPIVEHLG